MNSFKRLTTTAVGFSFLVVGATGIVFKFFFKNHSLEEIHGLLGLFMTGAALFHIWHNWGSLQRHLKKAQVYLLLIPVVGIVGWYSLPDKEEAERVNPRMVVGRLSRAGLSDLARVFGKSDEAVIAEMRAAGLSVDGPLESLESIAKRNERESGALLRFFVR